MSKQQSRRIAGGIELPDVDGGTQVTVRPGDLVSGTYRRSNWRGSSTVKVEKALVVAIYLNDRSQAVLLCAPDQCNVADAALKQYYLASFKANARDFQVEQSADGVPDEFESDTLFLVFGSDHFGMLSRFTQETAEDLAVALKEASDVYAFADVRVESAVKVVYEVMS